ncbi:MAG: hypothetical protein WBU20_03855 [Candidatus Acidiferrum sp.]
MSKHARNYVNAVVQLGGSKNFKAGTKCAALWIVGPIDDIRNTCLNDGPGTHRAGFHSNVKGAIGQAVIARNARSFANYHHFGVRGWVIITYGSITGASYDNSILHDHSTNWDLSRIGRSPCFVQC